MNLQFTVYDAFFQPSGRMLDVPNEAELGWNEFLLSFQCSVFDSEGKLLLLAPKAPSGSWSWELPGGYACSKATVAESLFCLLERLFPVSALPRAEHIRTLTCRSDYRFLFELHADLPAPALPKEQNGWRYVTRQELESLHAQGLLHPYAALAFSLRTMDALHFKTVYRSAWPRVLSRDFVCSYLPAEPHLACPEGVVSLMHIKKVTERNIKRMGGKPYTITDNGYYWFQFAPKQGHVWLTAMYDSAFTLIQYYFDISYRNEVFPDGSAYFFDLFLDLVLLPDGTRFVLDEDELLDAEAAGHITPEMTALAFSELAKLRQALNGRERQLQDWSLATVRKLSAALPQD